MNTSTITNIDPPNVRLPSLDAIGSLLPVDDIVDIADSAATRVWRLLPWTSSRSAWQRYALRGAVVVAVTAMVVLVARRRRSSDESTTSNAPTAIDRAA